MPPSTEHRFDVLYTETMLRDAVLTFVWRRFVIEQKSLWLIAGLMMLLSVYFTAKGQPPWAIALAASAGLMAPAIAALAWWVHSGNTLDAMRRLRVPRATVTLREDEVEFASEMGKGEMSWSGFSEIWDRPDYWMFFTGRSRFNVVPKAGASREAQAFLRERARRLLKVA